MVYDVNNAIRLPHVGDRNFGDATFVIGERDGVAARHRGKRPAGNAANASLVGANTVNGPGLLSVSTSPAAFTAATSVV